MRACIHVLCESEIILLPFHRIPRQLIALYISHFCPHGARLCTEPTTPCTTLRPCHHYPARRSPSVALYAPWVFGLETMGGQAESGLKRGVLVLVVTEFAVISGFN